jgi:CHAT domain-containing protein
LNLNIGEILIQLDAPSKALQYYRTARNLDSIKNISSTNILISSNQGMAWCYVQLGKMDSAMDCLTVCLELIKLTGTDMKNESSRILLTMGDIMAMKEEWEKSMKFYSLAEVFLIPDTSKPNIDKLSISNHDLDLYKVYEHRGRTYLQAARHSGYETATLACSFSDFLNALKICDHISKDFGQGPSRMKFHESIKPILAGAMESGCLLNEKKGNPGLDDLFYLADASKNRMLLDDMEECRSMKLSGVPDSTMEKIRHLKDQIVYYSRKYLKENPSPGTWQFSAMNEFQNKVINSKLELDSLREMIDRSYPDYSLKTKAEEKIHPARIIKSLDNDEALLEYVYADSIIYVFLIRADGSSMKRVVLPGSFTETLKESLHLSKSAGILKFSSLSRTLYQYLIAPVANRLNDIRRLIIIPDEELSLFPFETLISGDLQEPSDANPSSWHYLIRDFEITYHFSVEAWFKDTVMANLPSTSFRFAGFAPVFRKTPAKPGSLNLLPFTLKEVKGIAGLFGQRSMHQIVFLDTLATERNFRLHAPGNTHIHIATHSLISEKDPKNSALVFSKGNQYGGREDKDDGLLHLDEISNLRLGSSLVVLSACATGNGKVTRTEGVLALSRGFYLAGASNVVYSLWSIPDRLTSDFMMDFYRSYFTLNSYSAALREVKLKMISHPETSFPFMWAGIVLLGK